MPSGDEKKVAMSMVSMEEFEGKYFGWYMSFQHYVDDNPETTFIESDFEEYDCHLFLK